MDEVLRDLLTFQSKTTIDLIVTIYRLIVINDLYSSGVQLHFAPRLTACLDLGRCWLSEAKHGWTGSVFIQFYFTWKVSWEESSKQVASMLSNKD